MSAKAGVGFACCQHCAPHDRRQHPAACPQCEDGAPVLTIAERTALGALDDVLRTERLLARKHKAYEALRAREDATPSPAWVEASRARHEAHSARMEAEGLGRWAP